MTTQNERKSNRLSAPSGMPLDFGLISRYRTEIYGISILMIMFFHVYLNGAAFFHGSGRAAVLLNRAVDHGNVGVEIFLILSGISCYFSMSRDPNAWSFYKKRAKRLFIPMWLIRGPLWVWDLAHGKMPGIRFFFRMIGMKFWYDGDTEIWFISVILVCYLLYPLVFRFLYRKEDGLAMRGVLLLLVSLLIPVAWMEIGPKSFALYEIGLTRFPAFFLGCACGKLVKEKKSFSPAFLTALLIPLLFFCHLMLTEALDSVPALGRYYYLFGAVPMVVWFSVFCAVCGEPIRKVLRFFGKMSLELYLGHLMIRQMFQRNMLPVKFSHSRKGYLFVLVLGTATAQIALWIEDLIDEIPKKFSQRQAPSSEGSGR